MKCLRQNKLRKEEFDLVNSKILFVKQTTGIKINNFDSRLSSSIINLGGITLAVVI